jgi:hypothetical protein
MGRKLAVVLALAMLLLGGRPASAAIVYPPTDLEDWLDGTWDLLDGIPQGSATDDEFTGIDLEDDIIEIGILRNWVYYNGELYTYVHKVKPFEDNNKFFGTAFPVAGFTGVAGWDFEDSEDAGGCGGPDPAPPPTCPADFFNIGDFLITGGPGLPLGWTATFDWDDDDKIHFFYVSTNPPRIGNYHLTGGPGTGTAESYAPTPEPGSLMLLGSGVAALYGAVRRRNQTP